MIMIFHQTPSVDIYNSLPNVGSRRPYIQMGTPFGGEGGLEVIKFVQIVYKANIIRRIFK